MRFWTCTGCKTRHPRRKQKCPCGKARPVRKTNAQKALVEPYEWWTERFGETCNICGRAPSARRRLDRDHDHGEGLRPRGLLCARCNRALPGWVTSEWLLAAAAYLDKSAERVSWTNTERLRERSGDVAA
jgi:hypothetical protein